MYIYKYDKLILVILFTYFPLKMQYLHLQIYIYVYTNIDLFPQTSEVHLFWDGGVAAAYSSRTCTSSPFRHRSWSST